MTDPLGTSDIPDPELDPGWESDVTSENELQYWSIYAEISQQKHHNTLLIHKTIGFLIPAAIVLAFLFFLFTVGVYIAHILLPESCRWLTTDEVQHIHSMVFSSVVGGAVALGARMYLLKED